MKINTYFPVLLAQRGQRSQAKWAWQLPAHVQMFIYWRRPKCRQYVMPTCWMPTTSVST